MKAVKSNSFKMAWYLGLILVLLIVAGVGIYMTYQAQQKALAAKQTSAYETSTVTRGTISLGANGVGVIKTNNIVDLSFSTPGIVSELSVHPGDQVTKGQSMAALDNIEELKTKVTNAQLSLQSAKQTLADYESYPDKNISQAQQDLATADHNLIEAKSHLVFKNTQRCESNLIYDYLNKILRDQYYLTLWQSALSNSGEGSQFVWKYINSYTDQKYRDSENLNYCEGYSDDEINASKATLKVAQSTYDLDQAVLKKISDVNGIDQDTIAIDRAKIKNAELQLALAQKNLDGATLTAPFDGTVISVAGNLGDTIGSGAATKLSGVASSSISQGTESTATLSAGTSAFITIADLSHPLLDTSIDQSDYLNFKEGCNANVTFDSFPGKIYQGVVTLVSPTLAETDGYESVKGVVELNTDSQPFSQLLPLSLPASVEVVCQEVKNVLIIPTQALHNQVGNQADVYVLNSSGKPEKKQVTVGLSNEIFIEVQSGLSVGDRVIINNVPAL